MNLFMGRIMDVSKNGGTPKSSKIIEFILVLNPMDLGIY